jgi:hypothetical protein
MGAASFAKPMECGVKVAQCYMDIGDHRVRYGLAVYQILGYTHCLRALL